MKLLSFFKHVSALTVAVFGLTTTVSAVTPVAKWLADGDAMDSIGSNHGTLFNGLGFTNGHSGQAFNFDGVNDYVSFGTGVGNFGTNDFSIAFWIKAPPTASNRYIMGKRSVCNNDSAWQFSINTAGQVDIAINPDSTYKWVAVLSSASVHDGNYHHVAAVRNGTNILVYVDGVIDASGSTSYIYPIQNAAALTVGRIVCTSTAHPHFRGQLDEIQVFDRALDAAEVHGLANVSVQAPEILHQPTDLVVLQGNTAVFTVVASGTALGYQWYFEGNPIAAATNSSLEISGVQPQHAGEYYVVVSNSLAQATSSIVTLSIEQVQMSAWWKAEGNAMDSIGSKHGTLYNGAGFTTGKLGQAFSLDGINDYVDFGPDAGNFGTNDFTISFWMKSQPTAVNRYIVGKRSVCNNDSAWQFSFDTLGRVGVAINPDSSGYNWIVVTSGARVDDGSFHHVTAVRTGNALSLYVNGVFQGSVSSSTVYPIQNAASMTLGRIVCTGVDGHPHFGGAIDEFRIYDRSLTEEEIISNYNEGEAGPPVIAQQPEDKTVIEGAAVTFAVSATGMMPMQFQWFLNDVALGGATRNSLTISNVVLEQAGTYHVTISNSAGHAVSDAAELSVIEGSAAPDGLVAWWPAEGNAEDLIGSNHGSMNNGATFTAGRFGQAFYLDGVNDFVGLGRTAGNFGTNDFTISFWIQAQPTPVNSYIMGKRSICNNDSAWQFSLSSGGNVGVAINADANSYRWVAAQNTSRIDDSRFHHVATVREGTTLSLYVDGKLESVRTTPFVYNIQNAGEFTLGRIVCTGVDGHPYFAGQLDEVQLYHKALSSEQVHQLHNGSGFHESFRPPTIVLQPRDQRRNQGNSPTFKVVAVGSNPLAYQWHANGIAIPGATEATLTITNLSDTSLFSVLVSNPYGFVMSETARIVNVHPAGSYNGLFYESEGIRHESSGLLLLKLTKTGSFSARILNEGGAYRLSGRFVESAAQAVITRTNGAQINVELALSSEGEGDYVVGNLWTDTWHAALTADRRFHSKANPALQAGRYTLAVDNQTNDNAPRGDSFGAVRVSPLGQVRFLGNLADGSRAVQSVGISAKGEWPLYVPLYRGGGAILGWLSFTNGSDSSFNGTVSWIKTGEYGKYYPKGFTNFGYLRGSTYLAPTNRTLISVTNAIVRLSGDVESTQAVVLRSTDALLAASTNYQVLKMNPTSGLFKGKVLDPVAGTKIPIQGAVVQQATNAVGFFLTTNFSGSVNVSPQ